MQKEILIAGFGGQGVLFAGQVLTYAEPGHPEYRRYPKPGVVVVKI